jgi:phosphoglycolate phosphatase-like HAD superfamily hydrolase
MIVALDFDGTMVDTMPALERAAVRVISLYHSISKHAARRLYRSTIGASFPEQLEELYPSNPRNALAARVFATEQVHVYERARVFPRTLAGLDFLRTSCHDFVVVSSTSYTHVAIVLARELGPEELLCPVLGREAGTKAEQLTILQADCLIGDAPRDAEYARRAGARFIAVEHTFRRRVFAELGLESRSNVLMAAEAAVVG